MLRLFQDREENGDSKERRGTVGTKEVRWVEVLIFSYFLLLFLKHLHKPDVKESNTIPGEYVPV